MRHAAFLLGAILLVAASSFAQDKSGDSLWSAPSSLETAFAGSSSTPTVPLVLPSAATPASTEPPATPTMGSESSSEPPVPQSGVFRVFKNYSWQIYVGYAFFRFYALPSRKENMNGIDVGLAYYPKAPWIGADGEILAESGTFHNQNVYQSSKFTSYMGGPRLRWQGPRGIELWTHGLAGIAKFLPQTALGGQSAFSYEAGGGADLPVYHRRIAYRIEGDAVGTHFFHTYQWSPKISVGVVLKF